MTEQPSSQELIALRQALFEKCAGYLQQDAFPSRIVDQYHGVYEGVAVQREIPTLSPWAENPSGTGTFVIARDKFAAKDQSQPHLPSGLSVLEQGFESSESSMLAPGTNVSSLSETLSAENPTPQGDTLPIRIYDFGGDMLDRLVHPELFEPHHPDEPEEEDWSEDYLPTMEFCDGYSEPYFEITRSSAKVKGLKYIGRWMFDHFNRDLTQEEVHTLLTALDNSQNHPIQAADRRSSF